jgi:Ala-tRNA(Pro) deacylase
VTYHPVSASIISLLNRDECWHETFQHEPVRTSEEAAAVRPGYTLQQGAKAIIVHVKDKGGADHFAMLVFPADRKFDSKKARGSLAAASLRFASADEVTEVTGGVEIGAVPPFGGLFDLEVTADPTLFANERIVFNAGDRRFSVAMNSADYRRLVCPREFDIVKHEPA